MSKRALFVLVAATLCPASAFAHPGVHELAEATTRYASPLAGVWCALALIGVVSLLRNAATR
jgi:hypothetical protein